MDEVLKQIKAAQQGDKEARDMLVQENLGLIWSIVRHFLNRGYDSEELFQVGCIGLIKAVDKFDVTMEVRFSTYAVPLITGEIKRFLRDDGMLHISRSMKENAVKIKQMSEQIQKEEGREPTLFELSKRLQLSPEEIAAALASAAEVESLHKTIYQKDGSPICLMDRIEQTAQGLENNPEGIVDRIVLKSSFDQLTEPEQEIIRMRYFHDMTQVQTAAVLGVSQVQISRQEKKILQKLRRLMEV